MQTHWAGEEKQVQAKDKSLTVLITNFKLYD